MNLEIWKVIKDFSDYAVSDFGRIRRIIPDKFNRRLKILKLRKNVKGYFQVYLYKNGKVKTKLLHILLYEIFNNYKLKKSECIHHIDFNPDNNNFDNFLLMSKSEHMILHKTKYNNPNFGKPRDNNIKNKISVKLKEKFKNDELNHKGKYNPNSILTEKNVIEIRIDLKEGILTQREIGKKFGVSQISVSNIKTGRIWSHAE